VDRNFCTRGLLNGIAGRDGYFVIRQHGNLPIEILTPQRQLGTTATGKLHEQTVQLTTQDGVVLSLRRSIRVQLKSATRCFMDLHVLAGSSKPYSWGTEVLSRLATWRRLKEPLLMQPTHQAFLPV